MKSMLALVCVFSSVSLALAQTPNLINYQGRLLNGTNLVNGNVALSLRLFNASIGGALLYEDSNTVTAVDGLYATTLGDNTTAGSLTEALTNSAVWIEVAVNNVALTPREQLAAVGYALVTRGLLVDANTNVVVLPTINSCGSSVYGHSVISGGERNQIQALAENAFIGGGYFNIIHSNALYATIAGGAYQEVREGAGHATLGGGSNNSGGAPYTTVAGGYNNRIDLLSRGASVGGGSDHEIGINSPAAAIGGGFANSIGSNAVSATIGGGTSNRIDTASTNAVIGGGLANSIGTYAASATISGGTSNQIGSASRYAVIGGGEGGRIGTFAKHSVIAGGWGNHVDDGTEFAVIAGGAGNQISNSSSHSAIGGGQDNRISTDTWYAVIAGGHDNQIGSACDGSFIAGGYRNGVSNQVQYAFVGGRAAKALHSGTFVWGDNSTNEVSSSAENQVTFRCQGGVRFLNTNGTLSASWVPGAASWTVVSDLAMKENITPVDTRAVLKKVETLPVSEWNYSGYPQRHIGPMAQDFHAAFPLNENDRAIDSGDMPGIAFAAIQELARQNAALRAELDELKAKVQEMSNP